MHPVSVASCSSVSWKGEEGNSLLYLEDISRREKPMADFPYSPHAASIKHFLDHLQKAGVPDKVTLQYLTKVGFKGKNDRYLLTILKFLGFVDSTGVPMALWTEYRNRQTAGVALAAAMRHAYADLFRTYPDAHRKDNEALRNYFSAHTKVAESTLGLIVATFKALATIAEFEPAESASGPDESKAGEAAVPRQHKATPSKLEPGPGPQTPGAPAININIQLQLPATEDASVYENLFAALKKHLFS